jgi:predicted acetyltransferase
VAVRVTSKRHVSGRCGLTGRSSRPAPAGVVSPVRGTRCIIAYRAYAACLHGSAQLNVRPQKTSAMALQLRKAQPRDFAAVQQLLELYQYELSDIWPQDADSEAKYGYDLERHAKGERFYAHVALDRSQYIGFALVAPAAVTRDEGHWMEQFFVLKRYRRSGAGSALAKHVLSSHPGLWEVGQMPANLAAQAFWRTVIAELTAGAYVELRVTEGWWQGVVQQFNVAAEA